MSGPWARMILVAALVAGWLSVLHAWQRRRSPVRDVLLRCVFAGWLILFLPYGVLEGMSRRVVIEEVWGWRALQWLPLAFTRFSPGCGTAPAMCRAGCGRRASY